MNEEQKRIERMTTLFSNGTDLHDGFKAFLESIAQDKVEYEVVLLSTYDEKKLFESRALVNYQGQLLDRVQGLVRKIENENESENSRDAGPRVY